MVEVEIQHIALSRDSNKYLVLKAKDPGDDRICPVMIGHFEAEAIIETQGNPKLHRPKTHDLLLNTINDLGCTVEHVYVRSLEDETFFADVTVRQGDELRDIDARPSDAINLALRARVPIYIAEDVLDRVARDLRRVEDEIEEAEETRHGLRHEESSAPVTAEQREKLSAYSDLMETLSLEESEGEGPATRQ